MAKGRDELDQSHLAIVASQMPIDCLLRALDLYTVVRGQGIIHTSTINLVDEDTCKNLSDVGVRFALSEQLDRSFGHFSQVSNVNVFMIWQAQQVIKNGCEIICPTSLFLVHHHALVIS